ncbi:uracil phosphoribosyltransferase [Aequorivita sublithincola DSM 14238]|uniref:Uracil phosphoribosyltransferase n=1 Tax=Aequorivita sublithincola (strain DSM 14238 / LMG 21431 / ACAM 643 / 9-3) TaxID=746697 RepID=I3YRW4_AEQSU|nr:uracil phosphoribosyltransferase [Aequorivita sublithincola]AFL79732.1 uracil phosphoribosyltransferase [Aequorivita sublithincola DSM 14238]
MIVHDFSNKKSVLNQFISEMRDVSIQKDSMRFRKNIERIGEILSYEMSKTLNYKSQLVRTPLGEKEMRVPVNDLVVCSILRAALPFHNGILNFFDKAENAFISAFRHHPDGDDDFEVIVKYLASPSIENKTLILTDPMLATGKTLENVLKAFEKHGTPKQIHILSIIGAKPGIEYIKPIFPENTHLWIAAVDDTLNSRGYIVPGLGDAGDLAFGEKL